MVHVAEICSSAKSDESNGKLVSQFVGHWWMDSHTHYYHVTHSLQLGGSSGFLADLYQHILFEECSFEG